MIRNETEYQKAVQRLDEEKKRFIDHKARLRGMNLSADAVKRVLDPLRSFHLQCVEEVKSYKRLKRGDIRDIGEVTNLHGLGRMIVALRIALGFTQREFAKQLGVHESQVSRDERNEYHGITVERVSYILDTALAVHLTSRISRVGDGHPLRLGKLLKKLRKQS